MKKTNMTNSAIYGGEKARKQMALAKNLTKY
jgi:hypothetical protein